MNKYFCNVMNAIGVKAGRDGFPSVGILPERCDERGRGAVARPGDESFRRLERRHRRA